MNEAFATQLTVSMRSLVDRLDQLIAVQRRQAKALEKVTGNLDTLADCVVSSSGFSKIKMEVDGL